MQYECAIAIGRRHGYISIAKRLISNLEHIFFIYISFLPFSHGEQLARKYYLIFFFL